MAKLQGRFSDGADSTIPPLAVTGFSGADVGTNRPFLATANTTSAASAANTGGAVTLSWTVPSNSVAATQYLISSSPGTYVATVPAPATSYTFQGLAAATAYTFTITPQNNFGSGLTTTTGSVTATTVPQTMSAPTAANATNAETVTFSAPASNGGKAITSYTITDSGGTVVTGVTASPYTFAETAGNTRSFTIYAVNANGNGLASPSSNSATSQPPAFFAPPGFFAPPLFCIDQDTPIAYVTEEGGIDWKKASEIAVGDTIWSVQWNGLNSETEFDPYTWSSDKIEDIKMIPSQVSNIIESVKDITMTINNDTESRFSLEQTILIKRNNVYFFGSTGILEKGDTIVERVNGEFIETVVDEITMIDEQRKVYEFDAAPHDILIANGLIVHNKKFFA